MPEPRPLQIGGVNLQKDPSAPAPAAPSYPAMGARMEPPQMAPSYGAPAVRQTTALTPTPTGTAISVEGFTALGSAAVTKSASISSRVTGMAKASDMDDLGKGLTSLIGIAREYDPSRWNKGLLGFIARKTAKQLDAHFKSIDGNVDSLVTQLNRQVDLFRRRSSDLGGMSQESIQTYHDLIQAAEQGDAQIAWAEQNLPTVDPADPMSAQKRAEWDTAIAFGKKHVADLRNHALLQQMSGAQISQLKDNGQVLTMKFGSLIGLTIPALKQQYALYVIQMEQKKAVALADAVDDTFTKAITANAKTLHQNAIAINTSMARASVSVETLTTVHKELMDGLDDVARIRSDMVAKLAADAPQIEALSRQLADRQMQGAR